MKTKACFFVGILCLLLISACRGRGTDNKQPSDTSDVKAQDSSNIKQALTNVYYMFPSPVEILTAINQGGLVYKPELLNSIEKREKYVKPNDQYLNLGVYLADFSYCALFARNSDAEVYLETIKKLSDEVSLSAEIDKGLIEKVKNKVNPVDSLVKITDEFFFKVVNDLEADYRHNDVAIISIGAYIECLYLSVSNVNKYTEESLLIRKIAEQKFAFNILYQYCKKHISNKDLINSFSYLKQINDAFGQFSEHKEKVKVKKEGGSRLIITGGSISAVTEAEFKAFKENITKIRNSITK